METLTREDGCPKITIDRVDHGMGGYILYCNFTVESLNPHLEVDKCECADDVWTLVKFQIFVPTGDLWHKCSCVDFDVHGSTVSADGVFSLPRRPVKSQCLRQEVGACQDQPMMS